MTREQMKERMERMGPIGRVQLAIILRASVDAATGLRIEPGLKPGTYARYIKKQKDKIR